MRLILNRNNSLLLFAVFASSLVAAEAWIASLIYRAQSPGIWAIAVTADVAVGVPLLYIVLVARKKYLPLIGAAVLYVLALGAVRLILPASYQSHLAFVDAVSVELAAISIIAIKAREIVRQVRLLQPEELYFADALRKGIQQTLGYSLVANILSMELSLVFFAFFGWLARFRTDRADHRTFSYHRKGTWPFVFFTIMFIGILETLVLHLVIQIWNVQLAWLVTGLSIYTLWWLVGYFQSTRLQPVVISQKYLHLRTGFRYRATIPLSDIAECAKWESTDSSTDGFVNAAVFGEPGLVLLLKQPAIITGFFGKSSQCKALGIRLDDEGAFRMELGARIKESADFSEVV